MKIQVLNIEGKKKSELNTGIFSGKIREDVIQKVVEIEKTKQPYAPYFLAGKQASASGKISHTRRKFKTAAGHGISRVPRKVFWRRGTQFYWQAATISGVRGGRRAHPPRVLGISKVRKANKKEYQVALLSALALTASIPALKNKYATLKDIDVKVSLPIVVDYKILSLKTKDFFISLKNILNSLYPISIQKKSVRAGRGKTRGRKYRKTAGVLLVVGNEEDKKIQGVEVRKASELSVSDLASNGARLTIYTEKAVKDIEDRLKERTRDEKKTVKKKEDKRKLKNKKRKSKVKKKPKKVKEDEDA